MLITICTKHSMPIIRLDKPNDSGKIVVCPVADCKASLTPEQVAYNNKESFADLGFSQIDDAKLTTQTIAKLRDVVTRQHIHINYLNKLCEINTTQLKYYRDKACKLTLGA